jgi:hypothetical protein
MNGFQFLAGIFALFSILSCPEWLHGHTASYLMNTDGSFSRGKMAEA